MPKFRPKANPEVSAYQLTKNLVLVALDSHTPPAGLRLSAASWHSERREVYSVRFVVEKPNSFLSEAGLNDWIITDADGRCRVCGPETFAATYEAIPSSPQGSAES